jgi:hypothetical protein
MRLTARMTLRRQWRRCRARSAQLRKARAAEKLRMRLIARITLRRQWRRCRARSAQPRKARAAERLHIRFAARATTCERDAAFPISTG